jgi:hypothetical protein
LLCARLCACENLLDLVVEPTHGGVDVMPSVTREMNLTAGMLNLEYFSVRASNTSHDGERFQFPRAGCLFPLKSFMSLLLLDWAIHQFGAEPAL